MKLKYWGVRGTLPVAGKNSIVYGGNTSCVTVEIAGKSLFIFDAGTGIRNLGDHLMQDNLQPCSVKIFITHPHWDHIHGLPFFKPLYEPNNQIDLFGIKQGDKSIEELINGQMDNVYFPITLEDCAANIHFNDINEEEIEVENIKVASCLLEHPGNCLGYKLSFNNKSIAYITDNELYLPDSKDYSQAFYDKLLKFVTGTDILIMDTTYTDTEYLEKIHWGHSSVSQVVNFAHKAKAKSLHLFHHDPSQADNDIVAKHKTAVALLKKLGSKTECYIPKEGEEFSLS